MKEVFYTAKGYQLKNRPVLSSSMEDYLEMMTRNSKETMGVSELAKQLHVRSSSVTKMAKKLKQREMITYEKYGRICLTAKGRTIGDFLVRRHNILIEFFSVLNNSADVLEEVEQIEHYLCPKTINNIQRLTLRLQKEGVGTIKNKPQNLDNQPC